MTRGGGNIAQAWHLLDGLEPGLVPSARIHRHHYRGERWYVIEDEASARHLRVSPAAHYAIALMDSHRSLAQILAAARSHLGETAPSEGELITLLGKLRARGLVSRVDAPRDIALLEQFAPASRPGRAALPNPLSARFPLWDPASFLERAEPWVRPVFTRAGFMCWALIVGFGLVQAGVHWGALSARRLDSILDPQNLAVLAALYVFIKACHELGHAFATRCFGGEVHELGIMLIVGMPVPYVDASASTVFPEKSRRMVVAAAGVMVEVLLAALALIVWLNVADGPVRAAAWNVMLLGGVSTLLFNGNPLVRFDGYYVLADAIEIPNLATRSREYIRRLFEIVVLGLEQRREWQATRGERIWLLGYGLGSAIYRALIIGSIALFVAGKLFILGLLLACWALVLQVALPLFHSARRLLADPRVRARPGRSALGLAGAAITCGLMLFIVPLPMRTTAEGGVWMPEGSELRADADGFVTRVRVRDGDWVEPGDILLETEDPVLEARVSVLEARVRELAARRQRVRQQSQWEADALADEARSLESELALARQRLASTVIRSPRAGRVLVPRGEDLPGSFLERGEVIGYVTAREQPTIRTLVSQHDVSLVREATRRVEVRLLDGSAHVLPARIVRERPSASNQLPSLAFGAAGGGGAAVDAVEGEGLLAAESWFQFDLAASPGARLTPVGSRVLVRFEHDAEPVGLRIVRAGRRLLMTRLGV